MKKAKKEKRKAKMASAASWAAKNKKGGGEQTALAIPEGVEKFDPDEEGNYRVDLVPHIAGKGNPNAKPGELYFEMTYWMHWGIGVDNRPYICLKTFGKKCPICEHRVRLDKQGEDEDLVGALVPKKRQLFNVFNHDEAKKGVQVWDVANGNFGKHLAKKINGADEEDRERYEQFFDPSKRGYTLKLNGTEEKMGKTPYMVFSDIEFRKRSEDLDEELVESAVCLEDILIEKDYKELRDILLQVSEEDEDDDDEDKPKKKKKKQKEDDDGDEDEDEEDSEDEESGDDEEDEDSDDSDDDEGSEEEDEEEDFKVGQKVKFVYRGKKGQGKIVKINRKKAIAEVDIGAEKPRVLDLDELTLVSKKKRKDDDDEEDEDDEESEEDTSEEGDEDSDDENGDDEDDDEEEKPVKKGKKKKWDEDDEDDDEPLSDDDDDEDEPKPKKKKKK